MQPEELSNLKIPVTPSGIEPATFRLVAQCLNQLRHRIPPGQYVECLNVEHSCRPKYNHRALKKKT
jgi:hypothetical protein